MSSIPFQPSTFNSANRTSTVPIGLQQCQPDPSNGQIPSGTLQRSTFHSVLQTPLVDELPQRLSDSFISQPSIAPSKFCYWSTFYQISHATRPLQRTVFRQASISDKFQTDFFSNRTPVGFLQQKVSIRASIADDFCLQHQCLRHPTIVNPSATSKISELLLDC